MTDDDDDGSYAAWLESAFAEVAMAAGGKRQAKPRQSKPRRKIGSPDHAMQALRREQTRKLRMQNQKQKRLLEAQQRREAKLEEAKSEAVILANASVVRGCDLLGPSLAKHPRGWTPSGQGLSDRLFSTLLFSVATFEFCYESCGLALACNVSGVLASAFVHSKLTNRFIRKMLGLSADTVRSAVILIANLLIRLTEGVCKAVMAQAATAAPGSQALICSHTIAR